MNNKRGMARGAIFILILAILTLVVLSAGASTKWFTTIGTHTSAYNVGSVMAQCDTYCSMGSINYCNEKQNLKSASETLTGITCFELYNTKPEYGLEKCEVVSCSEEGPSVLPDDVKPVENNPAETKPSVPTTLDLKLPELCKPYSDYVKKYSGAEYGVQIDPALLFGIMIQESDCDKTALGDDGTSSGLMQINTINCGAYGLSGDPQKCKDTLFDPEGSIKTAAVMLRSFYDKYNLKKYPEGKSYALCGTDGKCGSGGEIFYKEWLAVIRRYNGWSCTSNKATGKCYLSTNDYVKEVLINCKEVNNGNDCLNDDGTFKNPIYN